MYLNAEQLRQLEATLQLARSGIRQLTIAASDVRASDALLNGKPSFGSSDIERYVETVSTPFIKPIESALAMLEASR